MLLYIARKVFGTRNDRILKSFQPLVTRVAELGPRYEKMSDTELQAQTPALRERLERGESLDSLEAEAYALVREVAWRVLSMKHFDVQLIGGAVLHRGMISEMKTGEGKTLMATLPAFLNGLTGNGVHIVTVNDYLAKRDAEWMGRVYNFLGLSVGVVHPGLSDEEKKRAYRADITYGQNNEFGFDYLRDNMKYSLDQMFQRKHHYAIVDEVDSILIDEARTPLIISGPIDESTEKYHEINKIVPYLVRDTDFEIELRTKNPTLTDEGVAKAEKLLGIENLYDPTEIETLHHVNQALKAHTTLVRDVDYVVKDGQVIIVDEFTGRLMPGRRWSNGLHQAVEAKEGLKIARENQTLASITFQNYFRMYEKLSGMTGTADTEAVEFKQIYNLEVVVIPTNRPMQRQDMSDVVFRSREEKKQAVVQDIAEIHKTGQPILVGTISIEQSEELSRHLSKLGVPHNVLNAKQHEREADIVSQAGRLGAVTISTNMAGRGTDIVLGGNPEALAAAESGTKDPEDPAFQEAIKKYKSICEEEKKRVLEAGGLAIIGTERHESRRIDNQLRGRAGRQGDPGSSRFYVSLEDDLMLRFGGEKIQQLMSRFGWDDGVPMDGRMISRSIETAQKRVESMHFESRKHVTEYDDVMNKQRQVIYNLRYRILSNESVREEVLMMIDDLLEELIVEVCDEKKKPLEWNLNELKERFQYLFNAPLELPEDLELQQQNLYDLLRKQAHELYLQSSTEKNTKLAALRELSEKEESGVTFHGPIPSFEEIEQRTILEAADYFWNVHLQEMDELREGIGLRGYGQKNPLYEYQREGFLLFQRTMASLREAVIRRLYYEEIVDVETLLSALEQEAERREAREREMQLLHDDGEFEDEDDSSGQLTATGDLPKDPDQERARREALKRQRRKKKR